MFCVDVFGEYIKFLSHLVQCNYEVCMLASCWEMRVLCPENRVKGRKIGFVQAVFCNSKLTLQLSLAPDCSTEYFLEVAGKARQSWVLHKTFAAAGGGEIIPRKNVFVQIKNVFVQIKNVFVQLATFCITPLQQQERGEIISRKFAKCVCPNYNMYLSKLRNVFVHILVLLKCA